jgi:uncharacterized membrane protein
MRASLPEEEQFPDEPGASVMNASCKKTVVNAPVTQVYEQWARIEDLPKFITPLRSVRRIDDTHFSYVWQPNGDEQRGVFHIILQIPDRRIAWRTLSNGLISGAVCFDPRSNQRTEVTFKVRSAFDPASLSRRVEEYLLNFKQLVENERLKISDHQNETGKIYED